MSRTGKLLVRGLLLLLVIALGSNYFIRFVLDSPRKPQTASRAATETKEPPANQAVFQSKLDAGDQALRDGRYSDALDRFLEAERSGARLSDEQYEALQKSRVELAKIYEAGGERSAIDSVYRALASCATNQARARYDAKQYDGAIARAQDAENYSNHLTEGKRESLQGSFYLLVNSLLAQQHYREAIEAQRRLIDDLKNSADDSDPVFVQAYMTLADLHAKAQDWRGFRESLLLMIESCDKTKDKQRVVKNWAEYNLVIAYYREGDTDTALSKADEFYTEYASQAQGTQPVVNVAHQPYQFASLALQIATEAKMPQAMDYWRQKGGTVQGSVNVIALHPAETR